jgi:hypothetical protein
MDILNLPEMTHGDRVELKSFPTHQTNSDTEAINTYRRVVSRVHRTTHFTIVVLGSEGNCQWISG